MEDFGFKGENERRYRRLVKAHGRVEVNKIIRAAADPITGLAEAEWSFV